MPTPLLVAAAAIVEAGRLLVVSKRSAPDVFYLPGGKPEPGEDDATTVRRELREELDAAPVSLEPLCVVNETAALEGVPMRMTVFSATLDRTPRASAELARLAWITGDDGDRAGDMRLSPALRHHILPLLATHGVLRRER